MAKRQRRKTARSRAKLDFSITLNPAFDPGIVNAGEAWVKIGPVWYKAGAVKIDAVVNPAKRKSKGR